MSYSIINYANQGKLSCSQDKYNLSRLHKQNSNQQILSWSCAGPNNVAKCWSSHLIKTIVEVNYKPNSILAKVEICFKLTGETAMRSACNLAKYKYNLEKVSEAQKRTPLKYWSVIRVEKSTSIGDTLKFQS